MTWTNLLNLWKAQNENHHTKTAQFPPKMLSNLNGIYATWDKLLTHTQDRIFHLTKEEMLTKSKIVHQKTGSTMAPTTSEMN